MFAGPPLWLDAGAGQRRRGRRGAKREGNPPRGEQGRCSAPASVYELDKVGSVLGGVDDAYRGLSKPSPLSEQKKSANSCSAVFSGKRKKGGGSDNKKLLRDGTL